MKRINCLLLFTVSTDIHTIKIQKKTENHMQIDKITKNKLNKKILIILICKIQKDLTFLR
jgi:hypothetical protein